MHSLSHISTYCLILISYLDVFVLLTCYCVRTGPGNFVCEPDEYVELVKELRNSGLIRDHWQGIRVHKNSFIGKEFVDWVVRNKQLGNTLVSLFLVHVVYLHIQQARHIEACMQKCSCVHIVLKNLKIK